MNTFKKILFLSLYLISAAALAKEDTPPTIYLKNKTNQLIKFECFKENASTPFFQGKISADNEVQTDLNAANLYAISIMYDKKQLGYLINPPVSVGQTVYLKFSDDNGKASLTVQDGILSYTKPKSITGKRYSLKNNIPKGNVNPE